jgi:hypothetical protein
MPEELQLQGVSRWVPSGRVALLGEGWIQVQEVADKSQKYLDN